MERGTGNGEGKAKGDERSTRGRSGLVEFILSYSAGEISSKVLFESPRESTRSRPGCSSGARGSWKRNAGGADRAFKLRIKLPHRPLVSSSPADPSAWYSLPRSQHDAVGHQQHPKLGRCPFRTLVQLTTTNKRRLDGLPNIPAKSMDAICASPHRHISSDREAILLLVVLPIATLLTVEPVALSSQPWDAPKCSRSSSARVHSERIPRSNASSTISRPGGPSHPGPNETTSVE